MTVEIAPWATTFDPGTIAGSVYSAPPGTRMQAARAIALAGHRVHVDMIIEDDGVCSGVSESTLTDIRRELPSAVLDIHLIVKASVFDAEVRAVVVKALRAIAEASPQRLIVSSDVFDAFTQQIAGTRPQSLWLDLSPAQQAETLLSHAWPVTGVLVMLIPPGTSEAADVNLLDRITQLRGHFAVGIDGGVAPFIAVQAAALGAEYLVSGRALLSSANQTPIPMKEVSS